VTAQVVHPPKLSAPQEPPILDGSRLYLQPGRNKRTGMKLNDLLAAAGAVDVPVNGDLEVSSVVYRSSEALPGSLFVAIRGETTDGNRFVADAISRGARVIVSELPPPPGPAWEALLPTAPPALPPEVSWVRVASARKSLAVIAANVYGRPTDRLQLVAVTGTNGKTTTCFLIDSILTAAGRHGGLFGTIFHRTPVQTRPAANTTPESLELQRFFAEIVPEGGTYAVLEASSHALVQERLWGCRFAAAVFTNLTRDHLDFHGTFENYFAAKRRLFEGTGGGPPAFGIINSDDPYGGQLAGLAAKTIIYGLAKDAQVTTKDFRLSVRGLDFSAQTPAGPVVVHSPLVGRINVYNLLAAIAAGLALDVPRAAIESGIQRLESVPGRFERINLGQPFLVVVDFAHTDDALRNLLTAAREIHPGGRIITLFGCGGNRDRSKRPLMGEAAGRLSDVVVLSSDNPRNEDPLCIINDALVGLQRTSATALVEPDRQRAIELAMDQARPGDIVLLAGKGHETVQVLKEGAIPFDDREMARRALRSRGYDG
jgi:UDP-N-acetylmuramoyl-L-alanyl-D-glutamate--2,6-diaminopimelate ligase